MVHAFSLVFYLEPPILNFIDTASTIHVVRKTYCLVYATKFLRVLLHVIVVTLIIYSYVSVCIAIVIFIRLFVPIPTQRNLNNQRPQ